MAGMSGGAPPTIQIPRWIQLVGLPILALIALLVVGKVFHAVFLFLVAALIALLLDPLVRALGKLRIPRGLSIAIVYLSFAAAVAVVFIALGVIVVDQTQSAANRIDDYLTSESGQPLQTGFEQDVDRLQHWLDTHHLESIDIRQQGQDLAENVQGQDVEKYTTEVIDFLRGLGVRGVGQSSWGPAVFAVTGAAEAEPLAGRVRHRFGPINVIVTPACNRGASVS